MAVDLYTKVMLTVIALALTTIAGENFFTPANAQQQTSWVKIANWGDMPSSAFNGSLEVECINCN